MYLVYLSRIFPGLCPSLYPHLALSDSLCLFRSVLWVATLYYINTKYHRLTPVMQIVALIQKYFINILLPICNKFKVIGATYLSIYMLTGMFQIEWYSIFNLERNATNFNSGTCNVTLSALYYLQEFPMINLRLMRVWTFPWVVRKMYLINFWLVSCLWSATCIVFNPQYSNMLSNCSNNPYPTKHILALQFLKCPRLATDLLYHPSQMNTSKTTSHRISCHILRPW